MFTYSHPHLLVLAVAVICLLVIPLVKCTNNRIDETSIEGKLRTSKPKHQLHHIFNHEDLPNNSNEDQIKQLMEDFFRIYPYRRASSFHAMRGKRFIKTN